MGEIDEALSHAFNGCDDCGIKLSQIMEHWKKSKCVDSPQAHLVFECYPCNALMTNIITHYKQDVCKHKWKYFKKAEKGIKKKGCHECMLVISVHKKK